MSRPTSIYDLHSHRLTALKAKSHKEPCFFAVDFFCGAGGTTRGLIDAGGYVIAGIDNDRLCGKTFSDNNRNLSLDKSYAKYLQYDVFPKRPDYPTGQQKELSLELENLIGPLRKAYPHIPLMFSICAPCQPFTKLARKNLTKKRKAKRAKDTNLLLESIKFIKKFSPDVILSENVQGINDDKYGGVWEKFKRRLKRQGYILASRVVDTADFGIPQRRKRTILIASKEHLIKRERFSNDNFDEITLPAHDPNSGLITVKQAIGHLPAISAGEDYLKIPNHKARNLSDLNIKRLSSVKPGENNSKLADTKYGDLTLPCHRRVVKKHKQKCFGDVYTRMHPDRPSPTITTRCHSISNGRYGHYDMKQPRGISLREAAILQSFPEDYVFYPIELTEPVARMIGNAVPPKLSKFFAEYLINAIDTNKIKKNTTSSKRQAA